MEERVTAAIHSESDDPSPVPNSVDNVPDPKSVTYTDYEDPFSLVHSGSGAPHIFGLSNFAWVGCGGDVYVLECLGKGAIRIDPIEGDEGK